MINVGQFRSLVIETLKGINMHSNAAVNLLVGTAAVESNLKYLKQFGDGPAVSFLQVEGATIHDNIQNYLQYRSSRMSKVVETCKTPEESILLKYNSNDFADLAYKNISFAIAMARIKYWRVPKKLPVENDIEGMAKYWKDYYNTSLGKGTPEKFIKAYEVL